MVEAMKGKVVDEFWALPGFVLCAPSASAMILVWSGHQPQAHCNQSWSQSGTLEKQWHLWEMGPSGRSLGHWEGDIFLVPLL
jgi:hypothetical protein